MYDQLDAVKADITRRLNEAATNRNAPMHTPVVATGDADARVMVLRAFDANAQTLRFHTDARAPKSAVVGDGAPVGVLFYDKPEGVQIRCRGEGRIVRDGALADAAWQSSDAYARRCYLGEGPGAGSDAPTSGLPDWAEGIRPDEETLVPARENFAVLLVTLREIDWFSLAHDGHRRAIFDDRKGRWVAP